jgi:hypothetical protein
MAIIALQSRVQEGGRGYRPRETRPAPMPVRRGQEGLLLAIATFPLLTAGRGLLSREAR